MGDGMITEQEKTEKKQKGKKQKPQTKPYTLEEIARMVRKINLEENDKGGKLNIVKSLVGVLVGLLFFGYMGYEIYKQTKIKAHIDEDCGQVYDADMFKDERYYGKTNTLMYLLSLVEFSRMTGKNAMKSGNISSKKLKSDTNLNFLLYGEPGTGKTACIKKFAYYLDRLLKYLILCENGEIKEGVDIEDSKVFLKLKKMESCVKIIFADPSTYLSKYHGQGEQNMKKIFGEGKNLKPHQYLIIYFDEIDAVARKRGENSTGMNIDSLKNQFLMQLDGSVGIPNRDRIVICGSTNRNDVLDKAMLRRFDSKIYFGMPNDEEIRTIFLHSCSNFSFSAHQIGEICKLAKGYNQATIMMVVKNLKSLELYDRNMHRLNPTKKMTVDWNNSDVVVEEIKKFFYSSEKQDKAALNDDKLGKHPYVKHLMSNDQKSSFLNLKLEKEKIAQ